MGQNHWIWRSDHIIGSDLLSGRRILDELIRQLHSHCWNCDDVFAVHLAIEEALVNAICHGNREDPGKQVQVRCRLAKDRVRVEIADEGPGFDPGRVPDPTDPDRLENPKGRGLLLMRAFMSRVDYQDSGRTVILEKDRDSTVHRAAGSN
jgi:serine/threonine-protein kinase RsbW